MCAKIHQFVPTIILKLSKDDFEIEKPIGQVELALETFIKKGEEHLIDWEVFRDRIKEKNAAGAFWAKYLFSHSELVPIEWRDFHPCFPYDEESIFHMRYWKEFGWVLNRALPTHDPKRKYLFGGHDRIVCIVK